MPPTYLLKKSWVKYVALWKPINTIKCCLYNKKHRLSIGHRTHKWEYVYKYVYKCDQSNKNKNVDMLL